MYTSKVLSLTADTVHMKGSVRHLFLEVVVREVEDLQSSVSPGQREPLRARAERHGSDSGGHVVEEADPVHFEFTHLDYEDEHKPEALSEPNSYYR